MRINPVILSGGSGTRLWPLSREHYPKQLLCLIGKETLLQQTVLRLDGLAAVNPLMVCNEEHRFLVAEQLRQLGKTASAIILEPAGRNTAPAATLAALAVTRHNEDGLMLIMPADHIIPDKAAFQAAVSKGMPLANDGRLVTFGVVPTMPATGYGYIKSGNNNAVLAFVEKPDAETANRYITSGEYLWNSGIFMMRASTWLDEVKRYSPSILRACTDAYERGSNDGDFYRVDKQAFMECESISIDYAVMERTDRAAIIPLAAGWSDVGAWSTLWEVSEQDANGNVVTGDVYTHNTHNTLLLSQHRCVAAVGLDNMVIVETADAVLVAHKDQAQSVKDIVEKLRIDKRSEFKTHRKVHRPWGHYEGVDAGERFQVKRLSVNPGAALSLQMHHHRAEHWVVVKGTARVTRGDEVFILKENQSTYIPIGMRHRLENPGDIPLEIIEIQSGSYLGEDDIVRFADIYNRVGA